MPAADGWNQISVEIGELRASVALLTRMVEEDRRASATYRTDIRAELFKIREDQAEVKFKVQAVQSNVAELAPLVKGIETDRLMALGAGRMAIWISRAFWTMGGAVAAFIMWYLTRRT